MKTASSGRALSTPMAAGLLVVGLLALAPAHGLAQGDPPHGRFYTVTTAEIAIPAPGGGTGSLQADVICDTGDAVVGGGYIIHPSSTTGIFVTKSYGTDTSGAFAAAHADRWRVKVLNPGDLAAKRLTVHAVCAKGGSPP